VFYHVCFVVPVIEQAMDDLGQAVRTEWSGIMEDSLGDWEYRLAFSRGGPPYIELIQGPPGSPWDSSQGARFHHIGYWSKDAAQSSRRLSADGFEEEFSACAFRRPYSYHLMPSLGGRLEMMDISRQGQFLAAWDPGAQPMLPFDV
jgi:hypothetical protein